MCDDGIQDVFWVVYAVVVGESGAESAGEIL